MKPTQELYPEDLDKTGGGRRHEATVEHLLYAVELLAKLRSIEIQAKTFITFPAGEVAALKREADEFLIYFERIEGDARDAGILP